MSTGEELLGVQGYCLQVAEVPGLRPLRRRLSRQCFTLDLQPRRRYNAQLSECGPDGDLGSSVDRTKLLLPAAPAGALIGKIGGSTAGSGAVGASSTTVTTTAGSMPVVASDGQLFVVGGHCVFELIDPVRGPLCVTINDSPDGFGDNSGKLVVTVSEAL